MKLKKAAMFGLDARIALAIFGALSVISGAALYSAIKTAKDTALLADLNEVGKAFEQYMLDTGQYLPRHSTTKTDLNYKTFQTGALAENLGSVAGWKGPYIPFVKKTYRGNANYLSYKDNTYAEGSWVTITQAQSASWVNWYDQLCTATSECFNWINFVGLNINTDFTGLDEKIDGGDGANNGKLRWQYVPGDIEKAIVYYNYMPANSEL